MSLDVVEVLSDLVRIPSVNPMGKEARGDIYYEHRLSQYLAQLFRQLDLPVERHTVAPQRDNVISRIDGEVSPERGGPIIMLEAHQDTVRIEGMTIDPFGATIEGGRLYGRGACDIKGGMAAMIAAVARLAQERPKGSPTVILACTVNEEHGFTGATHWAETYSGRAAVGGRSPDSAAAAGRSKLLPRVPDACIVAEPTQLNVVIAHKGAARWRASTRGRAAHSSQPQLGDNAIYHMARVVSALEHYAREVVPTLGEHSLCGQPTLSVGTITGGFGVNTVPDRATIEIDRRVLPGEDPELALAHCLDYLQTHVEPPAPLEHETPYMLTRGLAGGRYRLVQE
jgi:acetylornithine deacetylase